MKKAITTFLILVLITPFLIKTSSAQAPEGFVYQAELRNNKGRTLSKTSVLLDIRILAQPSDTTDWVWQRNYDVITDKYGMISVIVGDEGTPQHQDKLFSDIEWGTATHYLHVAMDDGSGWVSMGDPVMLMSVPYALHAKTAGNAINIVGLETGDILQFDGSGFVAATFDFYFKDSDTDSYGNENNSVFSPYAPLGYVNSGGDCNDDNPEVNPGKEEISNGIDDNCNGDIDEGFDVDGDGYTVFQGDCDDDDALIHPGANEICGDGIDQDCDEQDLLCPEDIDDDGDGLTENEGDCDDTNPDIPGGICDGGDSDNCNEGFWICNPITGIAECSDASGDNIEVCNGIDDDCDGQVDEDFNLDSDVNNCGACGAVCSFPHAITSCVAGVCEIIPIIFPFD